MFRVVVVFFLMNLLTSNHQIILITVSAAVLATLLYLRSQKQEKKTLEKKSKDETLHWQNTTEGREKEKQNRLANWGSPIFPKDYIMSSETKNLFTHYAQLKLQPIPSDSKILFNIKGAFYEAITAFPFRCIYALAFTYPRVHKHPNYRQILNKLDDNKNLRIIDLGCCMGTEIRHLLVDGFKEENVLGIDIQNEFIEIGIQLFNDEPSFKERFAVCNVLDNESIKHQGLPAFLSRGVDVVYCSAVYHLLNQEDTYKMTKRVSDWLPKGGVYFGITGGTKTAEPISSSASFSVSTNEGKDEPSFQFLHSVSSFKIMLERNGFSNLEVSLVDPSVYSSIRRSGETQRGILAWYAEKK